MSDWLDVLLDGVEKDDRLEYVLTEKHTNPISIQVAYKPDKAAVGHISTIIQQVGFKVWDILEDTTYQLHSVEFDKVYYENKYQIYYVFTLFFRIRL